MLFAVFSFDFLLGLALLFKSSNIMEAPFSPIMRHAAPSIPFPVFNPLYPQGKDFFRNVYFTQFVILIFLRCRFHAWWFHGYNNAFAHAAHRGEYGRRSVGLGGNIGKSLRSMEIGAKPSSRYEVSFN